MGGSSVVRVLLSLRKVWTRDARQRSPDPLQINCHLLHSHTTRVGLVDGANKQLCLWHRWLVLKHSSTNLHHVPSSCLSFFSCSFPLSLSHCLFGPSSPSPSVFLLRISITSTASAECTETMILLTFLFWLRCLFLCWEVRCVPVHHTTSRAGLGAMLSCKVQSFCRTGFACYYASRTTKLASELAGSRLLILLWGSCAEITQGLSTPLCMKPVFSGKRETHPSNTPFHPSPSLPQDSIHKGSIHGAIQGGNPLLPQRHGQPLTPTTPRACCR